MTEVKDHVPGTFCWAEVGTTDPEAGKRFYESLFGWAGQDFPMPDGGVYTLLRLRGADVAGLYKLTESGVPPHWMVYVCVDSADDAVKKARSLGGKVIAPPFDVMDMGRTAVLQDPTGAVFAVWQPGTHRGVGHIDEPGTMCWWELLTRDPAAAKPFYQGLFGWGEHTAPMGGSLYTSFLNGEKPVGGMTTPDGTDTPSHWMIYFSVADCDKSAEHAKGIGATVLVPPTDVPTVGRFAMLQDPQGTTFSIIKLASAK
jgi:hypothetical protein